VQSPLSVRELVAGIYFGQPRGVEERDGEKYGFNTATYYESEIRRIGLTPVQQFLAQYHRLAR
jgi:isocitrate/isopropylmalate dehydrogenase